MSPWQQNMTKIINCQKRPEPTKMNKTKLECHSS